jgi:hypothetical protein
MGFVEAHGGYGAQIGVTDYLPDGAQEQYEFPYVHGYSVGATAGVMLHRDIAIIATYEYAAAESIPGELPGVIDQVYGALDYHTAVLGVRLYQSVGFGRVRAEVGGGVLFPFATRLEVEHGAGLAPLGIMGTGTRVENYSVGFGGQAALGYDMPLAVGLYLGIQARVKLFQSENSGETTEYTNFVTDYSAPEAIDATIEHGDGRERPHTTSVQEARLQLALGYSF